jgi:hypothetical protein
MRKTGRHLHRLQPALIDGAIEVVARGDVWMEGDVPLRRQTRPCASLLPQSAKEWTCNLARAPRRIKQQSRDARLAGTRRRIRARVSNAATGE